MQERLDQYIPLEKLHPSMWAPKGPVKFREGWTVTQERTGYWEVRNSTRSAYSRLMQKRLSTSGVVPRPEALCTRQLAQHGTSWHPGQGGPAFEWRK
jgi:hypothetical protein